MKGYQEFKGYSTRLGYNPESGAFEDAPTPHAFSLLPNFSAGLLNFARAKLASLHDRKLFSRMSDRDLNQLGLDGRRNCACNDPHWGVEVRSRNHQK